MPDPQTIFRARHVATMTTAGVIEDGCIIVEGGRITAVGRTADLNPPRVDVDIDGLLTPGLVNAHTHLELTNVPRPATPGTFPDWLLTTMAATREVVAATFVRKRVEAMHAGIAQCLRFGVTRVGDVTQNPAITRPILAASPLRAVSFGECLGLGPRRERFDELLGHALNGTHAGGNLRVGVSPHAPYTVGSVDYARTHALFDEGGIGWTTHLAETPDEMAFVRSRAGPFAGLYRALNFDPGPPERTAAETPVAWLVSITDTPMLGLLAHVNFCTDEDISLLSERNAIVAFCPRTHAYFGFPPHRWRDMLFQGVNVCVATDSCASSPDLNVMDDLRLLRRQAPDVDPERLWDMVTINAGDLGGATLGRERAGVLLASDAYSAVHADLVAWPTKMDNPLAEVLDTAGLLPTAVWIGGRLVPSPGTPGEG